MTILVLGWYHSTNLGDAVLCDCTVWQLRRQFPQAQIQLRDMAGRERFSFDAPYSRDVCLRERRRQWLRIAATKVGCDRVAHHERWCMDQIRPAVEALGEEGCDLVVFAGGQLFMDSLALNVAELTAHYARRGIPVFFNACGTGPSWSAGLQRQLGQALTNPAVKHVSCRDDVALVNRWCGREVAVPTADPALWAAEVYGVTADRSSRTVGLGVMLCNLMPLREQRRFWKGLLRELDRRGIPWKLFTNGGVGDTAFARELLSGMPEYRGREEEFLAPPPRSPKELVQTIARFGSLISFRLHSHILACSLNIPTVALVWDAKLRFFFEKIGHPERCLEVGAAPGQVLSALEEAQRTGYDRAAILGMREEARALLTDTLKPWVTGQGKDGAAP